MNLIKIQPINKLYHGYRTIKRSGENLQTSLVYSPKSPVHRMNPVITYVDDFFQRSLEISRKYWTKPSEELKPLIKNVNIKNRQGSRVKMWDINKDDRKKYIITMHGLGQNISRLQGLYKGIIGSTDYAILAPEYQGYTEGSKGIFYPSPKSFLADVTGALEYLKRKGIKEEDIVLLGHSFGGYVATCLAEKNPNLSKLMLVCPMPSPICITDRVKQGKMRASDTVKKFIDKSGVALKELTLFFDTAKRLKNVKTPVDIVQTKDDGLIKVSATDILASKCKKLDNYTILESGGHEIEPTKIAAVVSLLQI